MSIADKLGSISFAFVRHAMSVDNEAWLLGKPWPGIPDAPLCARGRESLGAIANELTAWPVETVITSPLSRCIETAMAICSATGAAIEVHYDLAEVLYNVGDLPLEPEFLKYRYPNFFIYHSQIAKEQTSIATRSLRLIQHLALRPKRNYCLVGHRGWLMEVANIDIMNGDIVCLQAEFTYKKEEFIEEMKVKQIEFLW